MQSLCRSVFLYLSFGFFYTWDNYIQNYYGWATEQTPTSATEARKNAAEFHTPEYFSSVAFESATLVAQTSEVGRPRDDTDSQALIVRWQLLRRESDRLWRERKQTQR